MDLITIRRQIDECDRQLADVLQRRMDLVTEVAAYKQSKGMPIKDLDREKQVIEKVAGWVENVEYKPAVKNIMRCIIEQSCQLEEISMGEHKAKIKNLSPIF